MSLLSSAGNPLQLYGGQGYELKETFDRWSYRVRREGYVRDIELRESIETRSVDVIMRLLDNSRLVYCMTRDELMMVREPSAALERFLFIVEDDIRHYVGMHPEAFRENRVWCVEDLGALTYGRNNSWNKAHQKAKELFKLAAGKDAFDRLDRIGELPLTGSLGTAYTLLKQSTYSVLRPSDGAKLCAVVPSVPLWDHLLGLKLMIEHDEPKFLATANVAGGRPMHFNCRSELSIMRAQRGDVQMGEIVA